MTMMAAPVLQKWYMRKRIFHLTFAVCFNKWHPLYQRGRTVFPKLSKILEQLNEILKREVLKRGAEAIKSFKIDITNATSDLKNR